MDFFICSDSINDLLTDCEISNTVISKIFDHKAVKITTKNRFTNIRRPCISPGILKHKELELVVGLAAVECVYHHCQLEGRERDEKLRELGELKQEFLRYGPPSVYTTSRDDTELED